MVVMHPKICLSNTKGFTLIEIMATSDETLFARLDTRLGEGYSWSSGPVLTGGTIRMQTSSISLTRTPSTISTSGKWEIR